MTDLRSSVRAYQAFAKHHRNTLVVTSHRRTYGLVDPDGVFTSRHVCRGIVQQQELLVAPKAKRSVYERLDTVNLVRSDRLYQELYGPTDTTAEDVEWVD